MQTALIPHEKARFENLPVDLIPTTKELEEIFCLKFGDPEKTGPCPRLNYRFKYFTPDEYYEAVVAKLVSEDTTWMDVGCGRNIFSNNDSLARILSNRCKLLIGVDPDKTLEENPYVHEKLQAPIEQCKTQEKFDLVTLRMVAEHMENPHQVAESLAHLTKPGSKVVVYTINRHSPISLFSLAIPFRFHHTIKRLLWKTEERDTFPVAYKMNTKKQLNKIFSECGFQECLFAYLDDCRIFYRFRWLHLGELSLWRLFSSNGIPYPENCLLGVYERI